MIAMNADGNGVAPAADAVAHADADVGVLIVEAEIWRLQMQQMSSLACCALCLL